MTENMAYTRAPHVYVYVYNGTHVVVCGYEGDP